MEAGARDSGLRLAELVAAFSLATDLGLGQPMEHVLRSWLIASRLGDHVGVNSDDRGALYYVATLAWVGCVADTPEVATWFGDDIAYRGDSYQVDLARARRGKHFDPVIVDAFCAAAADVLDGLSTEPDWSALIAEEPALQHRLTEDELDRALEAIGDFTDLRSPSRAGHSRGVADLVAQAATASHLPDSDVTAVRRAGLLHDIGLHGVPATILDKPGPLSSSEAERLRLHAYYTERMLARPPALARLGFIASMTHERCDGSGYRRGLAGTAIPMSARLLAAACVYRAMVEPRPHRDALTPKQAAAELRAEVRAGRLDAGAVDAVLSAAGQGHGKRRSGPAGLTPREMEVLALIARGASTRQVAQRLSITPKTAETHIERIYAKTGASTRSTATLFAMQHGLLATLDAFDS